MEHALSNNFSRLFGTLQERHQVILSKGNKASSVLGHFLTTQELILEKRGPFCIKLQSVSILAVHSQLRYVIWPEISWVPSIQPKHLVWIFGNFSSEWNSFYQNCHKRGQPREVYRHFRFFFFAEVFFPFNFAPGISVIFGWIVCISEIQQFPEFLKTFAGKFLHHLPLFPNFLKHIKFIPFMHVTTHMNKAVIEALVL